MPLKKLKLVEESFYKFGQQKPRDLLQNSLIQKDIWLVKEDLGLSIPAHRSLKTINFILTLICHSKQRKIQNQGELGI